MRSLTLEEVAAAMGGRIAGRPGIPTVSAVSTDTRDLAAGSLFFAIKGARFDGHSFVNGALDSGAAAAVVSDVSRVDAKHHQGGRLIVVSDVVEALGRLAAWYRRQFAATVVAVVGSNGKTTTKDMIATVLGRSRRGRSARASFNNEIGVPLTLLSVEPSDEFVVVEIGTNHPGEVAALGRIARPDFAVVTSIGEEHLEAFGDLEGVAREEFSILSTMRDRAFAAISDQAAGYAPAEAMREHTVVTYGLSERADLRAADVAAEGEGQRFKVNGRFPYCLPLLGDHNVTNAMAAIAIGTRLRLTHEEMAAALLEVRLPPMRMERSEAGGITLINDAYNANPSSVRAALDVLDRMSAVGRKVLVLGDMRELGDNAVRCHQAVGREAGRSTAHVIMAVGAHARVVADGATGTAGTGKRIYSYPTMDALAEKLTGLIGAGDVVLFKASRGVGLERLVETVRRRVCSVSGGKPACKPDPAVSR